MIHSTIRLQADVCQMVAAPPHKSSNLGSVKTKDKLNLHPLYVPLQDVFIFAVCAFSSSTCLLEQRDKKNMCSLLYSLDVSSACVCCHHTVSILDAT